ncbi:(2Fe-2S) ferredoxin domain-containing protein [Bacillus sp. RG28]|uniref:(2Fe-2S) ferredoxin domain-containing protein n=1 Tax=Gottfriedia endophytica TaxID=2820819 RepID=A0A940NQ99_9BACI|nr:(2Fe-2S) ferredoxin domain-containing protein [Gottfriedia endophytica]MBP0726846.1 (2Fe-2S) ferredoxin domain-containing protein [Gottfriedia endophytica]
MGITNKKYHVLLCNGKSCKLKGAEKVTEVIRETIKECRLEDIVHTTKTLCNGECLHGPVVVLYPNGIWYENVDAEIGDLLIKQLSKDTIMSKNQFYFIKNS